MAVVSYVRLAVENAKKEAITDLLQFALKMNDPRNTGGRDVTAELVAGVDARLARFRSEPQVEADIRYVVGCSLLALGKFVASEAQFERAVKLRREQFGPRDGRTLQALTRLAEAYRMRFKLPEAADAIRQVLQARELAAQGGDERETLRAQVTLAYILSDLDLGGEIEATLRSAHERARARFGETDPDTLDAAAALVVVLRDRRDKAKLMEAKELGERTLRDREKVFGPDHLDTLQSKHDLATVLSVAEELDKAIGLCREAIDVGERVLPRLADPLTQKRGYYPDLLTWKGDLALMLHLKGDLQAAGKLYEEILTPSLAYRGEEHPFNVILRANYARLLIDRNRLEEAERQYTEVIRLEEKLRGPDDTETLMYRDALASLLSREKKWSESVEIYRKTLEARKKKPGADAQGIAQAERNLRAVLEFQARDNARRERAKGPASTRASDAR
jgi:tetratricopeptide (TPR) repeat protein